MFTQKKEGDKRSSNSKNHEKPETLKSKEKSPSPSQSASSSILQSSNDERLTRLKAEIGHIRTDEANLLSELKNLASSDGNDLLLALADRHLDKLKRKREKLETCCADIAAASLVINEMSADRIVEEAVQGTTQTLEQMHPLFTPESIAQTFNALKVQVSRVDEIGQVISTSFSDILSSEGEEARVQEIVQQFKDQAALEFTMELEAAGNPPPTRTKCTIL